MKRFSIINFLLFQACWALAASFPVNAPFFMLTAFAIHFALTPTRRADSLLLIIALLGVLIDQLLVTIKVLDIGQSTLPLWLILLWGHFTLCLNHSLSWLRTLKWPLQSVLGAIFGSFSYYMGLQVGAFNTFQSIEIFIFSYALVWAILLPLMLIYAQWTQR
ncbi:DUF2878 domain-containing protein [Vibrio gangliei]|uniref:DUF2878 domain-containing protein n=1 Tax=Vibrio gangliei TaxID=2077090 RepID=UPI000D01CA78|nr:DUF2878 domain-containing protein [Vibrio gangliei]